MRLAPGRVTDAWRVRAGIEDELRSMCQIEPRCHRRGEGAGEQERVLGRWRLIGPDTRRTVGAKKDSNGGAREESEHIVQKRLSGA